jgi:FMN hydrolase / 5-amino-6-(5-phospho-D-ribitylamino)uracil phosphatase
MDRPLEPSLIRAISFDLDDTLFDFRARMDEGAARVIEMLLQRCPSAAGRATVELFHRMWREATAEAQAAGSLIDWPEVRKRGIERLTLLCGCHEEQLVEELTALYFSYRHAPTPAFEDAAVAVAQLGANFPLGIITNANTRLTQIALADKFQVLLAPGNTNYRKPDPRIFWQAAKALGCAPMELLHVGDSWEVDVLGALQAGCQAAWYCRASVLTARGLVSKAELRPLSPGDRPRQYLVVEDHRSLVSWVLRRCGEAELPKPA